MIVLLVVTDGRTECLERTIVSAEAMVHGPVSAQIIYDDSGDETHRAWLRERFGDWRVIDAGERQGFGGAIRAAWAHVKHMPERFVYHLEDDFVHNRPVDLRSMSWVLDHQPHLVQLALRRQPWNDEEIAAGGIVEQYPTDYEDRFWVGHSWLEHRRFFTTNPSLYRIDLCRSEWPQGAHSEGHFTHRILEDPNARFAFWGARDSGEWVTHIGNQRAGVGY